MVVAGGTNLEEGPLLVDGVASPSPRPLLGWGVSSRLSGTEAEVRRSGVGSEKVVFLALVVVLLRVGIVRGSRGVNARGEVGARREGNCVVGG